MKQKHKNRLNDIVLKAKDESFKVVAEGDFERIHLITCNILQIAIK